MSETRQYTLTLTFKPGATRANLVTELQRLATVAEGAGFPEDVLGNLPDHDAFSFQAKAVS